MSANVRAALSDRSGAEIFAEAEALVRWHAGQLAWAEAIRDGRIQLRGPSWLVRAFPTWNARSMFAAEVRRAWPRVPVVA